jgi:hypothetical protein
LRAGLGRGTASRRKDLTQRTQKRKSTEDAEEKEEGKRQRRKKTEKKKGREEKSRSLALLPSRIRASGMIIFLF